MTAPDLLRRIRNDLPMRVTIAALGADGPPSKMSDGSFRFVSVLRRDGCGREPAQTTWPTASVARRT